MPASARRNLDSIACIALACAALAITVLFAEPPAVLTLLIGVPLAILAPGYVMVLALFPRHSESRMRKSTRLMFSLGMSIVCNILLVLALNYTAYGIRRQTLTSGLAGLTLVLAFLALQRAGDLPPSTDQPVEGWRRPSLAQGSVIALSLAIAIGAFMLATREAVRVQSQDVVQLWMLPAAQATQNGAGESLQVGVRNINASASQFRVTLDRDGYIFGQYDDISVEAGASWQTTATLQSGAPGSGPITALLYETANPTQPLRRVQYSVGQQLERQNTAP
jgi:hypothetical protein